MIINIDRKIFGTRLSQVLVSACLVLFLALATPARAQALTSPITSPNTGSYTKPQTVTLVATTGSIYYTTDGSVPTNSSTLYSSPITITSPTQINAVAYQSGSYSSVTSAYFDIDPTLAPILQSGLLLRLRSTFGIVTGVGSPVPIAQWIDLSGLGNNASAVSGNQPTLASSATGILGVNFNGSSQYLSLPNNFINFTTTGATFFLVVNPVSPSTNARFFDLGNGSASDNIYMSEPSTNAANLHIYNGSTDSSVSSSSAITTGQYQLLEGTYNGSNTGTIFTDGIQGAQNASMQTANIITRSNNFIGQASAGGNYYSGSIAEILIFATQLTTSQRIAIEAYLIQKYQLLSKTPRTPIISVATGTLNSPTQVVIASQPGTATYITTDGSTPTTNSLLYKGNPLTINYSQTLKAISVKNGVSSSVSSATYTLNSSQWPAPSSGDMTAPTINLQLPAPTL